VGARPSWCQKAIVHIYASLRLAKTQCKSNPATEKFKSGQLEIVSQREVEARA